MLAINSQNPVDIDFREYIYLSLPSKPNFIIHFALLSSELYELLMDERLERSNALFLAGTVGFILTSNEGRKGYFLNRRFYSVFSEVGFPVFH